MGPTTPTDYTPLWAELGLDLVAHDLLVRTLPDAYRRTYLSQTYRPEGMRYFDYMLNELHGRRVKELVDIRRAGGKVVGAFCPAVPEEVVVALGGTPMTLCAGVEWSSERAEQVLEPGSCSLAMSLAALKLENVCPHVQATDLIVGDTTCRTRAAVYELLADSMDVHLMQLPCVGSEGWREEWRAELDRLVRRLESLTGNELTLERLRQGVTLVNDKRRALKRLSAVRKAADVPISGRDALLISQFALYDDVGRYTRMVGAIADELEARVALRLGVTAGREPRVLVSGAPMPLPNWKLHHSIEEAGAIIVGEEMCTGSRYFDREIDENLEDLDAMLDDIVVKHADLDCACTTAWARRAESTVARAVDSNADAIIHHSLSGCASFGSEAELMAVAAERAGIAFLPITTDYATGDIDALHERVRGFLAAVSN